MLSASAMNYGGGRRHPGGDLGYSPDGVQLVTAWKRVTHTCLKAKPARLRKDVRVLLSDVGGQFSPGTRSVADRVRRVGSSAPWLTTPHPPRRRVRQLRPDSGLAAQTA